MINTVSHCELLCHWHAEFVREKLFPGVGGAESRLAKADWPGF